MIQWIYPNRCPVCLRIVTPKGAMLHPECKQKLDIIKEPVCMKCGSPLPSGDEEYCSTCACKGNRGWDLGRSIFPYHGAVGTALRLVKRDGREEFVRFFAKQSKESQAAFFAQVQPDCIVPVPLHPSRLRMRGFNQAELLAAALEDETGIPMRRLLIKNKKTKDQKSLSKNQRMSNVKNAYEVDEEALGAHIPESVLVLDDVITTGSTLSACAEALKAKGVAKVSFISICAAEQLE